MTALNVLSAVLAAVFLALGTAKILAVPSMRDRATHVGFDLRAYRRIGVLEVSAAAGLLVGLVLPALETAASVGLLALLLGALVTHLRVGDGIAEIAPAVVLGALVAGVLVLAVGTL